MKRDFVYISIILAVIVFFLLKDGCHKCPPPCPKVTKSETKTTTDSSYTNSPKKDSASGIPKKVKTEKPRVDSFIQYEPLPVDTAAILAEYNSRNHFEKEYRITDSLGLKARVTVKNGTHRNHINYQNVEVDSLREKTKTISNTITNTIETKRKAQLWLGINAGYRSDTTYQVGAELILLGKRKTGYKIGAKVDSRGLRTYEGGMLYKFGK